MFSGGPAGSWESAYQLAGAIANEGRSEPNIEPADRMGIEQLTRVAELRIADVTGRAFDVPLRLEPLNRTQWARRFLDDERPLLERLSGSIGAALRSQLGQLGSDPDAGEELGLLGMPGMPPDALVQQMMQMLGPMLLGMMAGSTAGHLAGRAFGHYELPVPRPVDAPLTLVLPNVDEFADAWSLPRDGIHLWVVLSDVAHHHVLSVPHVRERLETLLTRYVSAFSEDPEQIERRLGELGVMDDMGSEPELEAMQRLVGQPDVLLGAMQSDEQLALVPELDALVATIEGYVDRLLDRIGDQLVPEYGRITEALRRRRVEAGPANRFVERLFGLGLSQATFDRGSAFAEGVVARAGDEALEQLWAQPEHLPTPAELDAPGLWLARLGIEADDLGGDLDVEIPDFPDL